LHPALGKAAVEIEKRAVLGAGAVAAAVRLAAGQKPLQQGGMEQMGRQGEGADQECFSLAQGEGGKAAEIDDPTHI